MKIALLSAAAVGLCLVTSPALAGDVECIWQKLPQDRLAAYVAKSDGQDVTDVMDFVGEEPIVSAIIACKVSESGARSAGSAFAGITRQRVAEARLAKSANLTPQQLDAAWRKVDPEQAKKVALAIVGQDDGSGTAALDSVLTVLGQGLPNAADLRADLIVYAAGRATRDYFEPQF